MAKNFPKLIEDIKPQILMYTTIKHDQYKENLT